MIFQNCVAQWMSLISSYIEEGTDTLSQLSAFQRLQIRQLWWFWINSCMWSQSQLISFLCPQGKNTAVAQWLRCCATNRKVAGSIPAGVSGFFFDIKSFRSRYGPGVDSASNRNEYQEIFHEGKGGRCVRLTTLPPSCDVMKSGKLNLLEPSGPLQACKWDWKS